jgi:hypothetical protein
MAEPPYIEVEFVLLQLVFYRFTLASCFLPNLSKLDKIPQNHPFQHDFVIKWA